ncbi:MAG: copper amine oxidase N-terminal domain-containing protein [Bacillota bacterium]|nr:copper amine oxidase N-terminal domain-containing protein [Bacillota bacterium]
MKLFRKLSLAGLFILIFTLASASQLWAATDLPVILKINQYFVLYTHPKAPYLDNQNRLMVPLGMFCRRLLGANVEYDHQTKLITVNFSEKTLELTIGSPVIKIDGQPMKLDTVPVLDNGHVFIPLRALINAFDIKSKWNSQYAYVQLEDDRIMKTQTILYMEDTTRAQISDPDAFIPVSASLDVYQQAGQNTKLELITDSRNISEHDLVEGEEDIQTYLVYDTGYTYETPYSWQGRLRPAVKDGDVLQKRMTGQLMPNDTLNYILYWGRTIE